jgi:aspartate aminotransferase
VIVPAPYWAPYLDQVRLLGGTPVVVPCPQNNSFKLRAEDLQAAITPRTRWLIINNPVNPSGTLYRREDLTEIAAVPRRHPEIWIMADGLYEQIVFDADCAVTLAEIEPGLKPRTLTVSGIAKTYAMMGWRIGYAAGPSALIREMIKIQSQTTSCASSISQAAAIAALDGPQDLLRERTSILRDRRDRFTALVNDCPGLTCTAPEATFYLLVSCAGVIGKHSPNGMEISNDRDFATYLLQGADLAVFPGEDCGLSPAIRVSFANPLALIEEAGRRLKQACEALR